MFGVYAVFTSGDRVEIAFGYDTEALAVASLTTWRAILRHSGAIAYWQIGFMPGLGHEA